MDVGSGDARRVGPLWAKTVTGVVRAIGLTEYGGPDVLRDLRLDLEPLGPKDVRMRVLAAAVNPTDTFRRAGARASADRPTTAEVPGMDAAGIIVEVGPGVSAFQPGDRVVAIVLPEGEHGAYRSDLVVPVSSVARSPSHVTDAAASTIPLNGLTARLVLDTLGLQEGQVLAVTGAAGALGGYLVQLGKADGLRVIADSSPSDIGLMNRLGADEVVVRGPHFASDLRELHPAGADGLADASAQGADVLDAVRNGGTMVSVRGYTGDGSNRIRVVPVAVREVAHRNDLLARLVDQAERGVIELRVAEVMPADCAPEAHRRLEAGGTRGRLVLDFTA